MFGFIKNWLKTKSFKEIKQEYKQAKANWIAKVEDCKEAEDLFKAQAIANDIERLCFRSLRPDQEDCPPLIIHNYKKILAIANEEVLVRARDNLRIWLSESQYKDFTNKVSQSKEYKEWKIKQRTNKLIEDFQ